MRVLLNAHLGASASPAPSGALIAAGTRRVVFEDPSAPIDCPVWETEFPAEGHEVRGPALVVYPGQTLVIPPDASAHTDQFGNFVVRYDDAENLPNDGGK